MNSGGSTWPRWRRSGARSLPAESRRDAARYTAAREPSLNGGQSPNVSKIREKANSVTVFLKYAQDLKKGDKTKVLWAVPALIRSTNPKESIVVGLEIVETLGIKAEIPQDIVSGLETLRENSDANLKQRAVDLLRKFGVRIACKNS